MAPRFWLALVCCLAPVAGAASDAALARVPIVFHVAESAQHQAAIEPFIARQLAQANDTFAPVGLSFVDGGRAPLAAEHAVLITRGDRDRLLVHAQKGAIHCMLVARLMDIDEPGRERRGVHWHPPDARSPHLVILSSAAGDYVLAHELGHFFGNPAHSQLPGNLMSYLPGVRPPFLTEAQKRRVARSLARMRRSGEFGGAVSAARERGDEAERGRRPAAGAAEAR